MTHSIFGHPMLYTVRLCLVLFTSHLCTHYMRSRMADRVSCKHTSDYHCRFSLCQHLTTTNKFSGAHVKSVVRTSRWSSTLRFLPVFWIQLVALSHPLLHLKIAPRAVVVRSCSGKGRICTCTLTCQTYRHFLAKTPVS